MEYSKYCQVPSFNTNKEFWSQLSMIILKKPLYKVNHLLFLYGNVAWFKLEFKEFALRKFMKIIIIFAIIW